MPVGKINILQQSQSLYRYILAFGSNLGDRNLHAQKSLALLSPWVEILRQSPWLCTKPLSNKLYDTQDHEDYLNFVVEALSPLDPYQLYGEISKIEDRIGHDRSAKWLPRQIDIDILCYARHQEGKEFLACERLTLAAHELSNLTIPHPCLDSRDFLQVLGKGWFVPLPGERKEGES